MLYRDDFPIFKTNSKLIYFDNAASAQKPKVVIDTVCDFYSKHYSNIHRGPNFLSDKASSMYEEARKTVKDFISAEREDEIIFTKNSTESINLIAKSYENILKDNDVILISKLEHHANIVPFLQIKNKINIEIRYFDINQDGEIILDEKLLDKKVKLISISAMSNVLGTINNIEKFINAAKRIGAEILIDASQYIVHKKINVKELDVDYLVFTGHKLYAPSGTGVLYGKYEKLNKLKSFLGGGNMIEYVDLYDFKEACLPDKFEAGTANIEGVIGLKSAIDYINNIGFKNIQAKEDELNKYMFTEISKLDYIKLLGSKDINKRSSVFSFEMQGVHPHDIASLLSDDNICIRAGKHCAHPLHKNLLSNSSARISLAFYNEKWEIDKTIESLDKIYKLFN